jgi:hypothetical protein
MNTTTANEVSNHPIPGRRQAAPHVRQGAHPSTRNRTMIGLIGGLTALFVAASPVHAGELSVLKGQSIDLGRFHGVVHFTNEHDVYRVVATIADGESASPLRFSTTLVDNQSATISIPGKLGEAGHSLEISRSGDKLILTEGGSPADDVARSEM